MRSINHLYFGWLALWLCAGSVWAQANLEINTPAIAAVRSSMQKRFGELHTHYATGAVGLTRDGFVALRDANAVPLAQRQQVNGLVAAENQDRSTLYREIARANGKPEWENDIRTTFAQRWIDKAQGGWYFQNNAGAWTRK
ncbi:MAG: YdbL family protein [Betaproteobacteria bacterium]|nr:YdbL family protein [Betaproteobacteria bacterium]